MKFFAISDNIDTQMGMRLAGIDSAIVHEKEEMIRTLEEVMKRQDVGVVVITEKLMSLCPDLIYEYKLKVKKPLIVEIPDRHGSDTISNSISRYIVQSIGIKI